MFTYQSGKTSLLQFQFLKLQLIHVYSKNYLNVNWTSITNLHNFYTKFKFQPPDALRTPLNFVSLKFLNQVCLS